MLCSLRKFSDMSCLYPDKQTSSNCQSHDGKDRALSVEPVEPASAFAGCCCSLTMNLVFCSLEWG